MPWKKVVVQKWAIKRRGLWCTNWQFSVKKWSKDAERAQLYDNPVIARRDADHVRGKVVPVTIIYGAKVP